MTMQQVENLRAELNSAEAERFAAWFGKVFPDQAPQIEPDRVSVKDRRDFYALDIGTSGAFLVRKVDGAIFGIRGYGRPDYRKGIAYLGEIRGAELLPYRHARGPFRVDMKDVRV